MSFSAIPLDPGALGNDDDSEELETKEQRVTDKKITPGGKQAVRWEIVAETMGILPAQIIAGRLQSEGIPARAWQESIGQVHGLTVGPMGTGYVSVPDSYAELARETLDSEVVTDEQRSEQ